ncbi:MAG TPA: outer membrane beta-barrel protein [Gammaproteobacteria bacterium]
MSRLLLLTGLALLASTSQAQENAGAYFGFSLGSFDYEETEEVTGLVISDSTSAYRLFGGYRFSDNFAVEGSWGATGDIKEGFSGSDPALGTVTLDIKGDYEVLSVRALGILPFDKVSLFGGVGYYDADLTARGRYEDAFQIVAIKVEGSDDGATVIGGLQFDLDRLSIRGEYEWFDTDSNVDASDISIGLLFNF